MIGIQLVEFDRILGKMAKILNRIETVLSYKKSQLLHKKLLIKNGNW